MHQSIPLGDSDARLFAAPSRSDRGSGKASSPRVPLWLRRRAIPPSLGHSDDVVRRTRERVRANKTWPPGLHRDYLPDSPAGRTAVGIVASFSQWCSYLQTHEITAQQPQIVKTVCSHILL